MTRSFGAMLLVICVAALGFPAGFARAAPAKIKIDNGWGFGNRTVTAPENDAAREDIQGFTIMVEANLFVEGGDEILDGRFHIRVRGNEQQSAEGDTDTFADDEAQTVRGQVRWHLGKNLRLRVAKAGGMRVSSITENDPVQSLPCACKIGSLSDEGFVDIELQVGAFNFSVAVSPSTPNSLTTDGLPHGIPGGGGRDADNNNQATWFMVKAKFGKLELHVKTVDAAGDQNNDGDDNTFEFNGGASALTAHAIISIGAGILKLDYETGSSDLDASVPANGGATEEVTYIGVLLEWDGLYLGYGKGTSKVGNFEAAQTNLAVHYRYAVGNGYVAP
ncbi:MAG: hypothetical protein O7A69_15870, partial [SAR324 cluster bacterium]|nr:hypothetical protein [SAR324 cluster bacterium]